MGISFPGIPQTWETLVEKESDESRVSDTTVSADADLYFAVRAGEQWTARFCLIVTASGNTCDLKLAIVAPASSGGWAAVSGIASTATGSTGSVTLSAKEGFTTAEVFGVGAVTGISQLVLVEVNITPPTAGTVALYWAQLTSQVTGTTIKAGSWIRARRWS